MADSGGSDRPPDTSGGKGRQEKEKGGMESRGKSQTTNSNIGESGSGSVRNPSQQVKGKHSDGGGIDTTCKSDGSGARQTQTDHSKKNKNEKTRQMDTEQAGHTGARCGPFIKAKVKDLTGDPTGEKTGVHHAEKPLKQKTAKSDETEPDQNKDGTRAKAASDKQDPCIPDAKTGSQDVEVGTDCEEGFRGQQRLDKSLHKQNGTDGQEAEASLVSAIDTESRNDEHDMKESFCVIDHEGNAEIPINVKTLTGKVITIYAKLTDTIGKVRQKIKDEGGIATDVQRLIFKGKQLEEKHALLDYNIGRESTIFLVVDHKTDDNRDEVDKDRAVSDNSTRALDISKSLLQEKTENFNEKEEVEQPASSKSPTVLKSEFMRKHQDHSNDTVDNATASTLKLGESSEYKADDKDKDGFQDERDNEENMQPTDHASITLKEGFQKTAEDKGGTNHDDGAGQEDNSVHSETSGKVEAASADTCVNKVEPSDESIEKDDDNRKFYKNNLSEVEEQTEEQIGEDTQHTDNNTQPESGSPLSGSSSFENIAEGDQEETGGDETHYSIGFEMKNLTYLPDNCRKESENGTGSERIQDFESQEENRHDPQSSSNEESGKSEPPKDYSGTSRYTLKQIKDEYILHIKDYVPLKVPQLNGKSDVSILDDYILINGKVEYLISNESGEITVTKVGQVQSRDVSREIQKFYPSPVAGHDHGVGEIPTDSEVKTAKAAKIRATTPKVEELMKMQDDEKSQTDKCSQPVASINTDNSHMNSDEGEKQDLDLEMVTNLMGGMNIEDRMSEEPRQQEYNTRQPFSTSKPVKTDECEIAGKPPKAAPRKKHQGTPLVFTKKLIESDTVIEGYNLKLECCVSKPVLTAKWFKDETPIEDNERMKSVSSEMTHSLEIDDVNLEDSGIYTVKVENILSTSTVKIEEKPVMFTLPLPNTLETQAGKEVTFKCQVSKPGVKAEWTVGGQPVKDDGRFESQSTGMTHILVVKNVDMKDVGEYVVRIREAESRCCLQVYEMPSAPKQLIVGGVTSESCQLHWQKPESSGGSSIKGYLVQMREANKTDWIDASRSVSTHIVISNLKKKRQYLFRVAAENEYLTGEFAEIVGPITTTDVESWSYLNESKLILKCGESLQMQMNFKGPEPNIKVVRDGSPFKDERLQIKTECNTICCVLENLKCTDKGKYTMYADNDLGNGSVTRTLDVLEKKRPFIHVRLNHGGESYLFSVLCNSENYTKWKYLFHSGYKSNDLTKLGVQIQNQEVTISLKTKLKEEQFSETLEKYLKMTLDLIKELHVDTAKVEKGGHEVVRVIMNSDLAKTHEIYAKYFEEQNLLIYVCCTTIQQKARQEYQNALKCVHTDDHRKCIKQFRYQIGFDFLCDINSVQAKISSKFAGVSFECKTDYEKGDCKCSLEGPNEKVLEEAIEFIKKNVIDEHAFNVISFEDIQKVDLLDKEVLEKILSYESSCVIDECGDTNIRFNIDMNAKKIVIVASSYPNVDKVCKRFKNCITYKELEQGSLSKSCEKMLLDIQAKNKDRMFISKTGGKYYCIGSTNLIKRCMDMCAKDKADSKDKLGGNVSDSLSLKPYLPKKDSKSDTRKTKTVKIKDMNAFNLIKRSLELGIFNKEKDVTVTDIEENGKCGFKIVGHDDNLILKTEREIETFLKENKEEKATVKLSDEQYDELSSFKSNTEERCNVIIDLLKQNKVTIGGQDEVSASQEYTYGNGMTLKVSYGNAKDFWKDVLAEVVQGKGEPILETNEGKGKIQLFVPQSGDAQAGEDDGTHSLQASADKVLHCVKTDECTHVCLSLDNRCNWPLRKFIKQVLKAVTSYAKQVVVMPIVFEFCLSHMKEFRQCCKVIDEIMSPEDSESDNCDAEVPVPAKGKEKKQMPVCVVGGKLNEFTADVLVNTTSPGLDLNSGAVSQSLSNKAGGEMQKECRQKYKNGIKYGDIAVTKGYKLTCKHVFHGALEEYKDKNEDACLQTLRNFVLACLKKASSLHLRTIAFPAIGTGKLNYPIEKVAEIMFSTVQQFRKKEDVKDRMLDVYFVIYPEEATYIFNSMNMQFFKGEGQIPSRPRPPTSRRITVLGVTVNAQIGSLKTCGSADTLIHFWDNLYRVDKMNKFLSEAGIMADFFSKRDTSTKHTAFITGVGKLKNRRIVHVPVINAKDSLMQGFRDGILVAEQAESSSAIAFFECESRFLVYQDNLGREMIEAVKDLAPRLKKLKHVTLVVEGMPNPKKFFQAFGFEHQKEEEDITKSQTCISVDVNIVGHPANIKRAKQMFEEWSKSPLDTKQVAELPENATTQEAGAVVEEPEPQSMKRTETNQPNQDEEPPLGKYVLDSRECLTGYVLVSEVSEDYKFETLCAKMLESDLPVGIKKLIYKDGSKKAVVICYSSKDADKLSGFDQASPFKFHSMEREVLAPLEFVIGRAEVEKIQKHGTLDKFKAELKKLNADVNGSAELKIKVNTTCQMGWVIELKKKYCCGEDNYITVSAEDGFEHVISKEQLIKDVPEWIWKIMKVEKEETIKRFENSCGTLNFTGKEITIAKKKGTSDQAFKGYLEEFNLFVEQFKVMEYEEVDVDAQYAKNIAEWIAEIDETMKKSCCTFIPSEKKVIAYSESYEGAKQIKHHFLVKQNKIKTTGRRRKTTPGATESGPTSLQQGYAYKIEEENSSAKHIYPTFEWKRHAKNVLWYKTSENIFVYVYEANILNLNVECIVNAANDTLKHGGGVAKVIADGAGRQLDREGSDYIKLNGPIPVGHAMSTTAGKLPYKRVIHAVGPRWNDYSPHTYRKTLQCECDLTNAVYNSFMEAEKCQLKSIALPAISSAIFGVPEDLCVSMYVRATLNYSQDQTQCPVREIHFVDKNPKIIRLLQEEFDTVLNKSEVSPYLKKSNRGGQQRHGNSSAQTHVATASVLTPGPDSIIFPPKHTVTDKGQTVFTFCGSEDKKLLVYKGDLLNVKRTAIVVTIDELKRGGRIARSVIKKIPLYRERQYQKELDSQIQNHCQVGSVAVTGGYGSGFYKIFHVIFPTYTYNKDPSERRIYLEQAYDNVFYRAVEGTDTEAITTTLIGINDSNTEDVDLCADVFLEKYVAFAKQKLLEKKGQFDVHLVLRKDENFVRVSEMFKSHVEKQQKLFQKETESQMKQHDNVGESDEENDYESIKSVTSDNDNTEGLEDCVICMDTMKNAKTLKCGHKYCRECINAHFKVKKTCPTCGAVCGVITGDQPPGNMKVGCSPQCHCRGHPDCGQIWITYSFPDGRQQENHPDPGKWYKGITRTAYLPDNNEGRKIRDMLRVAFDRKLVFTVGRSRTTGHEGVITWNDIHHKTDPRPNTQFGYPDPTYLSRVKEELEAKGVTEDDIKKKKK